MLFPYKNLDSRIHRLDARPKIGFVAVMFLLSILLSNIVYLTALFLLVLIVAAVGGILRQTLGMLKFALFVIVFVIIFNAFLSSGEHVIFEWGPLLMTVESILFSVSMSMRLLLAVGAFSILTLAVHPDETLRIMSKFGYKSMTGLSLSTRMYPTIAADSRSIMDSMRARGVEFDEGNMIRKARARAPVLMPLLLNSLDRSIGIAEAMEARGFGARKRTNYSDKGMTRREKIMILCFSLAAVFGILMFVLGYGGVDYLGGDPITVGQTDVLVLIGEMLLLAPILGGGR